MTIKPGPKPKPRLDREPHYKFEWGVNVVVVEGGSPKDVVFTHEDPHIQTVNITRIQDAIKNRQVKYKRLTAIFDRENIKTMLADRDIDPDKVKQIIADPKQYDEPVIFVGKIPDLILIDGTHRVYTRFMNGEEDVKSYVLSYGQLSRFKVKYWVNGSLITDTRNSILKTYQHPKPILGET